MLESSTPALVDLDGYRNITELLTRRAAIAPDHVAFDVPVEGSSRWRPVTTREFVAEVEALAKGFIAVGVSAGASVAILAPTRYDWAVADLAAWFAGAVVVPIYDSSSPEQVRAVVADADVVLGIGGSAEDARTLRTAFALTGTGEHGAWSMDASDTGSIADLSARAGEVSDDALEERRSHADQDTPATIVYTSGTTGEPKGAVLTHRNFLGQVLNIADAYREIVHDGGNTVIFLPLAHVLARGLQLICLGSGMRIAHLSDPTSVVATLSTLRPTFLVVVPRVLQKIGAAAQAKASARGLSRVWDAAVRTAEAWGDREERADAGTTVLRDRSLGIRHAFFDRLFFGRLRTVMGGRVDYILSGGAFLDPRLSLFFRGIGVPVVEGYGLTETTAPLTGNLPGRTRSGTVGLPLPGSTVRISADGEVLAGGVGVFRGYRNPAHDADAFVDGFFRTGDLGRLDDAGRLVLGGRVKDVIVTSHGKTVTPAHWENTVEASPLVSHAVVVGEARAYLSALLVLDAQQCEAWAKARGAVLDTGSELVEIQDAPLREELQSIVDRANAVVSRAEQIKRFAMVFADPDDRTLVTPTMKLKRRVAIDKASDAVAALYR